MPKARIRVLAVGAVAVGIASACSSKGLPCNSDVDCPFGQTCGGGTCGGGGGGSLGGGICETEAGAGLSTHLTMQIVQQAAAEYTPTQLDAQYVTAYWAYLIVGEQTGKLDPLFVSSGLSEKVYAILSHYNSLFVQCTPGVQPQGVRLQGGSGGGLSCDSDCSPSAETIVECTKGIVSVYIPSILKKIPIEQWTGLTETMDQAALAAYKQAGAELAPKMAEAVTGSQAHDTLGVIGEVVAIAELGAIAAGAEIEATLALIGTGIAAAQCALKIHEDESTVAPCVQYKVDNGCWTGGGEGGTGPDASTGSDATTDGGTTDGGTGADADAGPACGEGTWTLTWAANQSGCGGSCSSTPWPGVTETLTISHSVAVSGGSVSDSSGNAWTFDPASCGATWLPGCSQTDTIDFKTKSFSCFCYCQDGTCPGLVDTCTVTAH